MVGNVGMYQNYPVNNYGNAPQFQTSDDYLAQAYRIHTQNPNVDTVEFSGRNPVEEPKKKSSAFGTILKIGLAIGGAVLLKKNWGKISKYIKNIFKGGEKVAENTLKPEAQKAIEQVTKQCDGSIKVVVNKTKPVNHALKQKELEEAFGVTKSEKILAHNKTKVHLKKQPSRKHKYEHTTVYTAKPITKEGKAKTIQNLDVSHVNSQQRKVVEQAQAESITKAEQEAYAKSIAYQAPTKEQAEIIAKNNTANAAERAEKNTLANNAKGGEKLAELLEQLKIQETA